MMELKIKFNAKEFVIPINNYWETQEDEADIATDKEADSLPKTLGELRVIISKMTNCDLDTMKLIYRGMPLFSF